MQPGNVPAGSASTLVLLLVLFLLCFVPPCVRSSGCPAPCSCKWKSGKQTAECSNQNLTFIPKDINPDTQVLDLSQNRLGELPSLVFQNRGLVNLQKVFLSYCSIRWVAPDAFYQLSNLVELDLTNNLLTSIPTPIFVDISMLRRLLMERNPIRRLYADSFGNLTYLTMLDLSECQISSIQPGAFRGLRNLEILKLNDNELTVLRSDVLQNLPPLYAFSLDKNPWYCDCNLKELRLWISENNIPTSIPPKCTKPERLRDSSWTLLPIEEFACLPEMAPPSPAVNALRGDNATLECIVTSVPEAVLEWTKDGSPLINLTAEELDSKFQIESKDQVSFLHISEVEPNDAGTYTCVAVNPAGSVESNFTLVVIYSAPMSTGWSKAAIIGVALGAFIALVLIVVVTCILVLRYRTINTSHSKFNGVGILKQIASKQKETSEVHVDKDTATEKTPRQETGSSGYGSDQQTPDLTNTNKDHHPNGPMYSTKAFLYSHPVHDSLTRETFNLHEQCQPVRNGVAGYHGYSNEFSGPGYQQVSFEGTNYGHVEGEVGLPLVKEGTNGYLHCDTDQAQEGLAKDESYLSYTNPAMVPVVPATSTSGTGGTTVTWKRTPLVVPNTAHFELPPDRRYSPDEGYAEEALEGTEV